MSYEIAGQTYRSKQAVTEKCRAILNATPVGETVSADDLPFLAGVFQHHPEWSEKSANGFDGVSVGFSDFYRTRYFTILSQGEEVSDISYPHAIKHIPSHSRKSKQPQKLMDFRNAARAAIRPQIDAFRAQADPVCALTGADLSQTAKSMHIDHEPPATFDCILFDFCQREQLNPLLVDVVEIETVPVFSDSRIASNWQAYHQEKARLRVTAAKANLGLAKAHVPWDQLFSFNNASV